jgi:hypothetical protein
MEDTALPQRVKISNGSISINLNPTPYDDLISKPDRLTTALEILVRVQRVKADLADQLAHEQFWRKPVEQIEKIPPQVVCAALQSKSEEEWQGKRQQYEAESQERFNDLDMALKAFAAKSNLTVHVPRGALAGYAVRIQIGPPKVRVRYMTLGSYKFCQTFHLNMDEHWDDLGANEQLIGRYRYLADWPQGKTEGQFNVTSPDQIVVITPGNTSGK